MCADQSGVKDRKVAVGPEGAAEPTRGRRSPLGRSAAPSLEGLWTLHRGFDVLCMCRKMLSCWKTSVQEGLGELSLMFRKDELNPRRESVPAK